MKFLVTFVVAFAICLAIFLLLDVALFNAQGLSFTFKG